MIETVRSAETAKTCCSSLYESDWARFLLGDSFHPGGFRLTERLGELVGLRAGCRVLDVASGRGTSTIFLARRFGCEAVGVEYGTRAVAEAISLAERAGLRGRVSFELGDAERLRFADGEFDAVICECAFCTFPDKAASAFEFARVLKPGGRVGLSHITRSGPLPEELESLLAKIVCIADAEPIYGYVRHLEDARFTVDRVESHDEALAEMVKDIRAKLLGAELLVKLKKLDLVGADFGRAKALAHYAAEAVKQGKLGYVIITGTNNR